ncbi:MAG: NrsF family protein [Oligoflexales bacterium]
MDSESLIDSLAKKLEPVKPLQPHWQRALAWSLLSHFFVIILAILIAPFRNGFVSQLVSEPQFMIEFLIGMSIGPAASLTAFYLAIPSEGGLKRSRIIVALMPILLQVLFMIISFFQPALTPSEEGHRPFCYLETGAYGIVPFVVMWFQIKKGYPWHRGWLGLYLALASFMPAANIMYIACMYDPIHNLLFHFLPAMILTSIAMLITNKYLVR